MTKSNGQDRPRPRRVLILGGTHPARMLAEALRAHGADVITALAGRTRDPILPSGASRIGGFGGAHGLARFLATEGIGLVVDATHPFAAQISANAAAAAGLTGTPLVRLESAPWSAPEGDRWIGVPDMAAAADALPPGARVFLTIGRQQIPAFFSRTDCRFAARMIEPPDAVPQDWEIVLARGPFTLDGETALIETRRITHLVSKNAGGPMAPKLRAAARAGIPVIMIDRPRLPAIETHRRVEDILDVFDRLERGQAKRSSEED